MRVAPGVEMLELSAILMKGPGVLCPTLLWDLENVVLVDAGLPGMARQFHEAMEQAGVPEQKLTAIIVTHHDLDHIGSLGELQKSARQHVEILAHREEVPYVEGERWPIKMSPEMMATLPEEQRHGMLAMVEKLREQKIRVDRALEDGQVLPYCGGMQVIHTPGHTPGHICLYLPASKTLIAGDSLFVEAGKLAPAPAFINADTPLALQSLRKLASHDVANVIAYHGGLFQNLSNARIAEIVS